jgi:RNA polymerase sigma-70 factor, ECF subfamily
MERAVTTDDEAVRAMVGRATRRDPDAWEHLYRRSYTRLFSYARRRLPDEAAAEDAVSETMTRALDNIDGFSWQGAGFDGWLYGIARNVILEARRRWRPVDEVADHPTVERGPEEEVIARDQAAAMRIAFQRLAPEERELLELRVQGGLSSEEVGARLGKRAGASPGRSVACGGSGTRCTGFANGVPRLISVFLVALGRRGDSAQHRPGLEGVTP